MADIVIIGAGLGGIPMALEMKEHLRSSDKLTVICKMDTYQFIPSNPWVAVGWRKLQEIEIPLAPIFRKRNINWSSRGKHIHLAKIAFEKYFLHKLREGITEPFYEKALFKMLGVEKLKSIES